jgi:hypothetical protein
MTFHYILAAMIPGSSVALISVIKVHKEREGTGVGRPICLNY